jgi:chromosome partitioning protein
MLKDPETKLPVVGCANYKGGVGKTTLAVHFATWCWRQGLKVLFIDTDQQGSATCMFGIDPTSLSGKDATLEAFWSESKDFKDVIYNTHLDGLDIVPANVELAHVEITIVMEMMNRESREERMAMFDKLSNGIDTVKDKYDIVILDCPPSLGLLTNIVMLNMTHCFLPVRPSFLDFASTMDYLIKLGELTEKLAPNFEYESIKLVASDYNATSKEHQGMFEMMTESFENLIYPTPILRSDSITKASSELKSVYEYEDSVKATQKRSLDNLDILFEAMLSDIEKSYSKEPLL